MQKLKKTINREYIDQFLTEHTTLEEVKNKIEKEGYKIKTKSKNGKQLTIDKAIEITKNLEIVEYLCEKGAFFSDDSLNYAVRNKDMRLIGFLLDNGALANNSYNDKNTLDQAIKTEDENFLINFLAKYREKYSHFEEKQLRNSSSIAIEAVNTNNKKRIELILKYGNANLITIGHLIAKGDLELIKIKLNTLKDKRKKSIFDSHSLRLALKTNPVNNEIVEFILNHTKNNNVNIFNPQSASNLMQSAITNGNIQTLQLLLQYEPRFNFNANNLCQAIKRKDKELVKEVFLGYLTKLVKYAKIDNNESTVEKLKTLIKNIIKKDQNLKQEGIPEELINYTEIINIHNKRVEYTKGAVNGLLSESSLNPYDTRLPLVPELPTELTDMIAEYCLAPGQKTEHGFIPDQDLNIDKKVAITCKKAYTEAKNRDGWVKQEEEKKQEKSTQTTSSFID